jgi:sodium/potassium-transporting ATPase subunit alpha
MLTHTERLSLACAQYLLPGDTYPLDHTFSKNDGNYPGDGYCFVGLVSLEDPPKHGVREAIGTLSVCPTETGSLNNFICRRMAGIKVMMVTGK